MASSAIPHGVSGPVAHTARAVRIHVFESFYPLFRFIFRSCALNLLALTFRQELR